MAVIEYRDRVRDDLSLALSGSGLGPEGHTIVAMVIEHELMHHETLLYMVRQLPRAGTLRPSWLPPLVTGAAPPRSAVPIPPGSATVGASFDRLPFGWDNEFPEHRVEVPAFAMDAMPVTNAAYREFVDAGGYERRDLWSEEAWAWKERAGLGRSPIQDRGFGTLA